MLHIGIKLIDDRGNWQGRANGTRLFEREAQILAHPVNGKAKVELVLGHRGPAIVHLPALRRAARYCFIDFFNVKFRRLRETHRFGQRLDDTRKGDLVAHFGDLSGAGAAHMDHAFGIGGQDRAGSIHRARAAAADGSSKWITSELARADVAVLRSQADAIVTSTATVKADNPLLTSKGAGKNPVRIVMGETEISPDSQVLNSDAETVIIKSQNFQELISLSDQRGFNQILVESGPTFGTALLKADLVDEIILFQAPTFFGSGTPSISDLGINSISQRLDFDIADVEIIGADLKITLVKSQTNNGSGR